MFFVKEKIKKRIEELKNYRYVNRESLPSFKCIEDETKAILYPYSFESDFEVGENTVLQGRDKYFWLETELEIPKIEDYTYLLLLDLGKHVESNTVGFEALLFINNELYQAIDGNHKEVFIDPMYSKQKIKLSIRLWTGLEGGGAKKNIEHRIRYMDVAQLNKRIDDYYYLVDNVYKTIIILNENNEYYVDLLMMLDSSIKMINWNWIQDNSRNGIAEASQWLYDNLANMQKNTNVKVTAIGHTHIDVAWLWRLKHTREKAARSFSTVLRLMEQYPAYIFLQTQPQLYEYVKEDYPELYKKIKDKIKENKWEIEGAMWLESDSNIPSGESLVRQILYGKQFMKKEFDVESKYLWLPDVFGYSWALPQILKKSGIELFMTTKISWNQYNRMPHDTFIWKGIDGSEILTHFITTPDPNNSEGPFFYTYNGVIEPYTVKGIYDGYRDKNINKNMLLAYGYGDGGGGVNRDMLESISKIDLIPGVPHIQTGKAGEYFEELKCTFNNTDQYVHTWDGELYLEYHRGTYTSQAYNKKMNRKLELKYKQSELKTVFDKVILGDSDQYRSLYHGWKILLRNQFHDIIPGSSIEEVYEDSKADYKNCELIADAVLYDPHTDSLNILNDSNWNREHQLLNVTKWVSEVTHSVVIREKHLPIIESNHQKIVLLPDLPPSSVTTLVFSDEKIASENERLGKKITIRDNMIETPYYSIKLNDFGWIESLFDKEYSREVIESDKFGNQLIVYEDKPMNWDAWDIDIFNFEKFEILKASTVKIVEENVLYSKIEFTYEYGCSTIKQYLLLYADNRRLDFLTDVDWHEKQKLLRCKFDVNILAKYATYDIQFGNVSRPNNWNTSWDWARFESVGHQWADLSQNDYGVALLNDCKYGYAIKDKSMQLSLLKSAIYPDTHADEGKHTFTYSLLPHYEHVLSSNVIREAYNLNSPLSIVQSTIKKDTQLFEFDFDNEVVSDAIKVSEDGNGVILRLHEASGCSQQVKLKVLFDVRQVFEVNLMEEKLHETPLDNHKVTFNLTPYEIKSLYFAV